MPRHRITQLRTMFDPKVDISTPTEIIIFIFVKTNKNRHPQCGGRRMSSEDRQSLFSDKAVLPRMIRANGALRASFSHGTTCANIATLYEQGGYRLKFPKSPLREAVIVNTGGGMAGGDRLDMDFTLGSDAECDDHNAIRRKNLSRRCITCER